MRIRMLICKALAIAMVLAVPACQPQLRPPEVVPMVVPDGYSFQQIDISSSKRMEYAYLAAHIIHGDDDSLTITTEPVEATVGCVVAFEDDGWVYGVTCYHCVPPVEQQTVKFLWWHVDGQEVEVVARDPTCDLATIRWRPALGETYTPATFATPVVGERAVAVVYAKWTRHPAKPARVDRHIEPGWVTMSADNMIGITCPTRPGCSGSPVFNASGDVIGLVSAKFPGCDSYGYAVDARMIRRILKHARD